MWFHIVWCDVTVVLCHPAACVLFHPCAFLVENTAVSKLLRLRFLKLRQVLGFHSGINNLHFLLLYDIMLPVNWLVTFRETVWVLYPKEENFEDGSALWKYNHHFSSKILGNQWRGDVTTHFVVLMKRWDETVARITGKKYNEKLSPKYLKRRQHLEWIFLEEAILLIWILNK